MMAKPSSLSSIFDDEPEPEIKAAVLPSEPEASPATRRSRPVAAVRQGRAAAGTTARKDSHPGKKPVLIHIPEDMHRTLRQLSVEEGGEPLTVVTERLLREYLVKRGHTKFAP